MTFNLTKYLSLSCLLFIFYTPTAFAGLNLCSSNNTLLVPTVGYSNLNSNSMFGTSLSFFHGPLLCIWKGGYIEYFTDVMKHNRVGVGGHIGFLFFGLDLGASYYHDSQDDAIIYRIKPFLITPFFNFYYGLVFQPTISNMDFYSEVGFVFHLYLFDLSKIKL
jgi:hypothetical protein